MIDGEICGEDVLRLAQAGFTKGQRSGDGRERGRKRKWREAWNWEGIWGSWDRRCVTFGVRVGS